MGLFDWFGGGGRSEAGEAASGGNKKHAKVIAKAVDKLRNPHVQTQERQRLLEVLQGIGTEEAVGAMLQRFTMRTPGAIVDEDEKRLAYEALLALGEVCLEPIERFIGVETSIYWPLRAYTEIAGPERTVGLILGALDAAQHGYDTESERREQLVSNLREFPEDRRAMERLVALTLDESTECRILALDGLPEFDDPVVLDTLLARLADDEEALRVKTTIVDILSDRQLPLGDRRAEVEPYLSEMFFIDEAGVVQRR